MNFSLDLNLLPIYRRSGQDLAELPGLYLADRPRRAARSRSADQLILFLSFSGGASLPREALDKLLSDLAKTYYKVPGSVTSALREVAESLNGYLFNVNKQNAGSGQPVAGLLSQVVRRGDQIYLAQSGPLHAYLITAEGTVHDYEPGQSGRGLGLSNSAQVRYFHASLTANDTLLLADRPSPGWDEDVLATLYGQGPEGMRRRLLAGAPPELKAFILQAKQGKGKIFLLRSGVTTPAAESLADSQPMEQPRASVPAGTAAVGQEELLLAKDVGAVPEMEPAALASTSQMPAAEVMEYPTPERGAGCNPLYLLLRPVAIVFQAFASLLNRVIPGETIAAIPNSTMAFLALLVPIVVVAIATAVYIQRGTAAQSQVVYAQALELVRQAENETDVLAQRATWKDLLEHLDKTDIVYSIPEASELRSKAQRNLDEIDKIRRLDFQPAIFGGLPASVDVSRIVLGEDEIFLLDENSGDVYHATLSNQGYLIDENFQCGPSAAGVEEPLIDIVAWPTGFEPQASLLGLNANGGVVYCMPGQAPITGQLAKPLSSELTGLVGFAMELGNLYVLDPDAHSVWIYWDSDITQLPQFFFGDQVPPMKNVADLVVNHDELYLLHADGHLTLCEFSWLEVAQTRCTEPVIYFDTRPARENSPLIPEHPFSQILYNPPPDPSLYLLEPSSRSIYHFSLRSPTFQQQYMPVELPSDANATAFALDSFERIFFFATGNDVYYGRIP